MVWVDGRPSEGSKTRTIRRVRVSEGAVVWACGGSGAVRSRSQQLLAPLVANVRRETLVRLGPCAYQQIRGARARAAAMAAGARVRGPAVRRRRRWAGGRVRVSAGRRERESERMTKGGLHGNSRGRGRGRGRSIVEGAATMAGEEAYGAPSRRLCWYGMAGSRHLLLLLLDISHLIYCPPPYPG